MNTSVIIPALNEEESLGHVLSSIPRETITEIIVVDGGSTDNTVSIVKAAGARVIQEPKRGYGRACATGVEQVKTLSDYQQADFGTNYGLLIKGLRLLARAVMVIAPDGKVQYIQVVPEVTDEPDYEAAVAAVKQLL